MAGYTEKYKLIKPSEDDFYNIADFNGNMDLIDNALKNMFNLIYPVGCIYMSVSATNPATLFGGTWSAWGAGRVPVGINASDAEFNTVEKAAGEKSHILTTVEMPYHTHSLGNHAHSVPAHAHGLNNHTHGIPALSGTAASAGNHGHNINTRKNMQKDAGGDNTACGSNVGETKYGTWIDAAGEHTHGVITNASTTSGNSGVTANSVVFNSSANNGGTGSAGSNEGHNILQPYIVCYMWKRIG